jgi:hypothetical protein
MPLLKMIIVNHFLPIELGNENTPVIARRRKVCYHP